VDAETDADLAVLSQSETTIVNAISSSKTFNVRVEGVQGVDVTGVNFEGGNNEGKAPFAYCGDSGGNYKVCADIVEGQNTVTSTAKITGKVDLTTSITFILVTSGTPAPMSSPAPTAAPVTEAPVAPPPTAPLPPPTPTPIAPPTSNPIAPPTPNPVSPPTPNPVPPSTPNPIAPPTPNPVPPPTSTPPFNLDGTWQLKNNQPFVKRHEACFVMVGDKAYLMGGRESDNVDIYDPATDQWSKGKNAPLKLHHLQVCHIALVK